MSKYNIGSTLDVIEEVKDSDTPIVGEKSVDDGNKHTLKLRSAPNNISHPVLEEIDSPEVDAVPPVKRYIPKITIFGMLPKSEPEPESLPKEELERKIVSNFNIKVNNNKLEAINPDKEVNYVSRDSGKAWYNVIWDCICCCKKSSANKTKTEVKIASSFFDDFDQTKHDFVDIKSSLLDKNDPESQESLLNQLCKFGHKHLKFYPQILSKNEPWLHSNFGWA